MSEMLETYSLSFKGKKGDEKDYELKFKVAKGVSVSYKEDGDIHKIQLNWDNTAAKDNHNKNYKITGPLKVQFFQNPAVGAGKDGPPPPTSPDPDITIQP